MKHFFIDTFYLVALLYRRDAWHDRVVAFSRGLSQADTLLTTDAILVELLAALSTKGEHMRQEAAYTARMLMELPNVTVIAQNRVLLLEGLDLYERRIDKEYTYGSPIFKAVPEIWFPAPYKVLLRSPLAQESAVGEASTLSHVQLSVQRS